MEEHEYYEMVLNVGNELENIDRNRVYYEEIDWDKLKKAYKDIGILRKECSETIGKQLAFRALEATGIVVINNIKRMLYDMGGIAHDD